LHQLEKTKPNTTKAHTHHSKKVTTWASQYHYGKTNLDFTEARDIEWQWHQLGRMQVCTSLQTDNYASTPPLSFLQARCPSCRPTNSIKALKAMIYSTKIKSQIKGALHPRAHMWING